MSDTLDLRALTEELVASLEELNDHIGDDLGDSRSKRIEELRKTLSRPQAGEPAAFVTQDALNRLAAGESIILYAQDREKIGVPLYASPQPANPAQVTDAMVRAAYEDWIADVRDLEPTWSDLPDSYKDSLRGAIAAAIGAGSAEPSLLDRERAAMDVTQRRAIEGERISDAVLAWMVKYDLLDAGNEYHVSDVLAVLDDLAPSDRSAAIGTGGQAVAWQPMDRAPKDGTMLRLLVRPGNAEQDGWTPFTDSSDPYTTIGFNALSDTLVDEWQFAGWDWCHDCFTDGAGDVIGWLPFDALSQPHPADERVVEALREACNFIDDERDRNPDSAHPNDRDEIEERIDLRPKLLAKIKAILATKEGR